MFIASCVTNVAVRRIRLNSINQKSTSTFKADIFEIWEKLENFCVLFNQLAIVLEMCMKHIVLKNTIYMGQYLNKRRKPSNTSYLILNYYYIND